MNTTHAARSGLAVAGAELTASTWLADIRRRWAGYRAYRRTLAELRELDDKALTDLGMPRDALRSIAREAVYGN